MDQEILNQIISKVFEKLSAYPLTTLHPKSLPIGVSNRHLHLSQADLETLFGAGYAIQCIRDLSQPGQCAGAETVIIAGPKGCIEGVRVLGPVRKQTQIEISRSDTFKLGVNPPTRESGKLEGSGGITVIGPKGSVQLKEGLIIAKRHIHMTPFDAATYGVNDGQSVQVKVDGERGVTFDNVVVRVSDKFSLEFHIDIDEANGAGIKHGDHAKIVTSKLSFDPKMETVVSQSVEKAAAEPKKEVVASVSTGPKVISDKPATLVTDEIIREAWINKAAVLVKKGALYTPLAVDTIKELGVEIITK